MKTANLKNHLNQKTDETPDYFDLNPDQRLLVDSFSKIFKIEREQFINIIAASDNTNFHLARIFECVSMIRKDKQVNAVLLLEYLLISGSKAIKITDS